MPERQLSAPASGPLHLTVDAEHLDLHVRVVPGLSTAEIVLTGDQEMLDTAQTTGAAGAWTLKVRTAAPITGSVHITGRRTVINADVIHASVIMTGSATVIDGVSFGRGATLIGNNGVSGSTRTTTGPDAYVRLPQGSSLTTRLRSGTVRTSGRLERVDHQCASGLLVVAFAETVRARSQTGTVRVLSATQVDAKTLSGDVKVIADGPVRAHTLSGDVKVTTGGPVDAHTVSGDVKVTAAAPTQIDAHTVDGDITVDKNGHPCTVRHHTVSGTVRVRG
ncbi:DUF4097 family beta strand repeat-containing protein [Nocardiopsis sp. NPDC006198]|uniref:DUF4097 family beta strand repeat-containing protein n=1 Tax=Nocardiopsis sp. NPDC006198 TaxID=3154472 RepID=UPI0033B894A8